MGSFDDVQARSLAEPEAFWAEAASEINWHKPFTKVLDDTDVPFYRWFSGGELNTCYNALDRHVEQGRGEQTALIYDSPVTDTKEHITYSDLLKRVSKFAGALVELGVSKGDRVIIYMPMIPEAAIAMLACARLGAVHSVVFGGFAANELATRIDDCSPKVIVSASCGIEVSKVIPYKPLLDEAIDLSTHKPDHCVIWQRPQAAASMIVERDIDWADAEAKASGVDCVPVAATDPLYILYTSGTTGQPKGIVRDNGGHAVVLHWSMKNIYNVEPGEVFWGASDVGWVVGHSYIVYGPLIYGATSVMYEGKPVGTPDPGAFWRVISEHSVSVLFTAPTAFRAIRQQDPDATYLDKYDLSHFRTLFLAGERCDPDTLNWALEKLGVPVIDHWWQTETGWPIASNCLGIEELPIVAGSPARSVPGWDVRILDAEDHNEMPAGDIGAIVCKLPLPPGTFSTLWNAKERHRQAYLTGFPGFYETGDAGYKDENGYIYVMSRTDDIINVAGHRLSTGAMEEVLAAHEDVAECAVIGVADKLKGQLPLGFMVLKAGSEKSHSDVVAEVVQKVRHDIGPVAAFKLAVVVDRLPKTRSGKILRATMRKIADNEDYKVPATIDDPVILDEIRMALQSIGYGMTT
ncbi:propionyl-CoA synthetase [Kiloniella sp. EL199]|uniref:propionyl-CoA synthetase n=1 Tax=Kiloniella sp. EL199 TaxID=2107581 RepID=UPI000EA10821|nr:propionyl-CoA synthetase [Kiloniella sp. EL199]